MGDKYAIARLKKGVEKWNLWRGADRRKDPEQFSKDISDGPDLGHANFRGLDLFDAYLVGADLQSTDLRGANLRRAQLRGAKLYLADLRGANMVLADISEVRADWADFSRTNLRATDLRDSHFQDSKFVRATLRGADIRGARFLGADLTHADLTNTLLANTIFGDATLRTTRGLDVCFHEGPSIIDYHTLVKSGELPVEFLRECGLSNGFIAKLPSVLDSEAPLRCFISYAVEDERLVEMLDSDLQRRDIRCWYFRKHAIVGRKLRQDIAERIEQYDKVILICSEGALRSPEVRKELELAARKEDRMNSDVLVPIRTDEYVFGNWRHPRKSYIVEKMICDFEGWRKRGTYDTAFEKLFVALHGAGDEHQSDSSERVSRRDRKASYSNRSAPK